MIVIDEKGRVSETLKKLGLEFCDFFDHLKVENLKQFNKSPLIRRPDIVILDYGTLVIHPVEKEDFKIQINTYAGLLVFCQDEQQKAEALQLALEMPKVLGVFGPNLDPHESVVLGNLLSYFWSTIQEQRTFQQKMYQFSVEIEQLMESAQEDMMKPKAIHEKFLPKRTESVKGLNFHSKFMTGSGRGVEFLDLITTSQKCYQVHLTTSSYLVSGTLLSLLEKSKQKGFDLASFLQEAWSDIATIQDTKTTPLDVNLAVIEFDLKELAMTVHGKSDLKILRDGKIIDSPNHLKLSKGEKLIVLSSGYVKNLKQLSLPFNVEKVYDENKSLAPHDLLNELIFKLKSAQETDQDMCDMIAVMVEVNRHGIHQI